MLKQRVITALVLLPIVLGPILFLPTWQVYTVLGVFVLVGAHEWTAMMGVAEQSKRLTYVALVAAGLALGWWLDSIGYGQWVLIAGLLWWASAIGLVVGFPGNFRANPWSPLRYGVAGLLMLVPALLGLAQLHAGAAHGIRIFFLFGLVWAADIGAYFAGRAFGRHKLAPEVSPGKTIEGAVGGFMAAMLVLIAAPWIFGAGRFEWLPLAGLSAIVVAISVIGDLTESLFKRLRGMKDSGTLLPGHGGVLDRIDSLLAAAPTLALGLALLGV